MMTNLEASRKCVLDPLEEVECMNIRETPNLCTVGMVELAQNKTPRGHNAECMQSLNASQQDGNTNFEIPNICSERGDAKCIAEAEIRNENIDTNFIKTEASQPDWSTNFEISHLGSERDDTKCFAEAGIINEDDDFDTTEIKVETYEDMIVDENLISDPTVLENNPDHMEESPIFSARSVTNKSYEKIKRDVYSCNKCPFHTTSKARIDEHTISHEKGSALQMSLRSTSCCCCRNIGSLRDTLSQSIKNLRSQKANIRRLILSNETFSVGEEFPIIEKKKFLELQNMFNKDTNFNRDVTKWLILRCGRRPELFVKNVIEVLFHPSFQQHLSWFDSPDKIKLCGSWVHHILMEVNYHSAFGYSEAQIQYLLKENIDQLSHGGKKAAQWLIYTNNGFVQK